MVVIGNLSSPFLASAKLPKGCFDLNPVYSIQAGNGTKGMCCSSGSDPACVHSLHPCLHPIKDCASLVCVTVVGTGSAAVIHEWTDMRKALTLAALIPSPPWPTGKFRLQTCQSSMEFPFKHIQLHEPGGINTI